MKKHHIAGPAAGLTTFVAANQTVDTVREHIFLSAHEFISHAGLLRYSLAACVLTAVAAGIVKWRQVCKARGHAIVRHARPKPQPFHRALFHHARRTMPSGIGRAIARKLGH